jgi:hypothetical protein
MYRQPQCRTRQAAVDLVGHAEGHQYRMDRVFIIKACEQRDGQELYWSFSLLLRQILVAPSECSSRWIWSFWLKAAIARFVNHLSNAMPSAYPSTV